MAKFPHFSDESYVEIIDQLLFHYYEFVRIDDENLAENINDGKKRILLRHDVDISPNGALKLGKIEADKNVVSNFFFQLNAETYQMISHSCINICKELQSMGHLVGLHVDSALFLEEENKINGTIDWVRDNFFPIDYAVSFHRPLPESLGKKYTSFVSTYDGDFFNLGYYASDSRGEDSFYEKLESLLVSDARFIQLLLHPCWWENETDKRKIWERIRYRKMHDLENYVIGNFKAVFGDIIKNNQ